MKKWMYLIFPGAMLGLFLVFFLSHTKEAEAREQTRLEALAKKVAQEAAKKKEDETRARKDAEDAVKAAVNFLDAPVTARFLDDARDAGVDDGGGTAGLGDEQVACEWFSHRQTDARTLFCLGISETKAARRKRGGERKRQSLACNRRAA